MAASVEKKLTDFLLEISPLIENINKLSYSTITELYDLLDVAAKSAISNIKIIDTNIRAEICMHQDTVLERIVDLMPSTTKIPISPAGIYTPAVHNYRRWSNAELLKDKCLAGYMLAKTLDTQAFMYYCTQASAYPYRHLLPELNILYTDLPSGAAEVYHEHLQNEYKKMDVLILHGIYAQTVLFLDEYRKLRPDGKVYCGLDMNSYWMSNVDWGFPLIEKFFTQCDVVATSCTSLRDALNKNPVVNFSCRWLPNGFFNFGGKSIVADANCKKNIILTAGRIGNAEKNNEELLLAFAKISSILKDWTLRLVGPVEPEFQQTIKQFFSRFPGLKNRVVFTGLIENKAELYKEYSEAKIFALTSPSEGGTPNVYAEALFHGCMFVTSDIDAADDIINHGDLGIKYKLGDIDALASALVELSRKSDKNELTEHISKAVEYGKKHFDWDRNGKKLAYMMFKEAFQL